MPADIYSQCVCKKNTISRIHPPNATHSKVITLIALALESIRVLFCACAKSKLINICRINKSRTRRISTHAFPHSTVGEMKLHETSQFFYYTSKSNIFTHCTGYHVNEIESGLSKMAVQLTDSLPCFFKTPHAHALHSWSRLHR